MMNDIIFSAHRNNNTFYLRLALTLLCGDVCFTVPDWHHRNSHVFWQKWKLGKYVRQSTPQPGQMPASLDLQINLWRETWEAEC